MNVKSAGKTDIGLKRSINEDSYLIASDLGLYIVADGMGGHKAGHVASRMVVDTIENYWRKVREGTPPHFLENIEKDISDEAKHLINSIYLTNIMIYEAKEKPQYKGMGSTISALLLEDDCIWAANVGDSRIYSFSHGHLVQVSEEHSLEAEQRNLGIIDSDNTSDFSFKNILTRVLGLKERVKVFIISICPEGGDIILMCSDGLTNYVSELSISAVLDDFSISLERKVDILIDEAKRGGGGDNISVVLLEVLEQEKGRWSKFKKSLKL